MAGRTTTQQALLQLLQIVMNRDESSSSSDEQEDEIVIERRIIDQDQDQDQDIEQDTETDSGILEGKVITDIGFIDDTRIRIKYDQGFMIDDGEDQWVSIQSSVVWNAVNRLCPEFCAIFTLVEFDVKRRLAALR